MAYKKAIESDETQLLAWQVRKLHKLLLLVIHYFTHLSTLIKTLHLVQALSEVSASKVQVFLMRFASKEAQNLTSLPPFKLWLILNHITLRGMPSHLQVFLLSINISKLDGMMLVEFH